MSREEKSTEDRLRPEFDRVREAVTALSNGAGTCYWDAEPEFQSAEEAWQTCANLVEAAERLEERASLWLSEAEEAWMDCPDCEGRGRHTVNENWPEGTEPHTELCSTCGGSGDRPEAP